MGHRPDQRTMTIVVSDASVLLDLDRGCLLEAFFRLHWEFIVPDQMYALELRTQLEVDLPTLGLQVVELDAAGQILALTYQNSQPALSQPDCLALALAKSQGYVLLTGDRHLRHLAAAQHVAHHGLLWALDEMADARVATHNQLCCGLRRIRAHPRCRLPEREVRKRLSRYCPQ